MRETSVRALANSVRAFDGHAALVEVEVVLEVVMEAMECGTTEDLSSALLCHTSYPLH